VLPESDATRRQWESFICPQDIRRKGFREQRTSLPNENAKLFHDDTASRSEKLTVVFSLLERVNNEVEGSLYNVSRRDLYIKQLFYTKQASRLGNLHAIIPEVVVRLLAGLLDVTI
jgi:hypothetical protein